MDKMIAVLIASKHSPAWAWTQKAWGQTSVTRRGKPLDFQLRNPSVDLFAALMGNDRELELGYWLTVTVIIGRANWLSLLSNSSMRFDRTDGDENKTHCRSIG